MESHKILIVDDTEMFRELGSLFLARTGRVLTARNAAEGLAVAKREFPDVIVVDLNMPGMDGDVFCKVVRSDPRLRNLPLILLISSESADDRARAVHAGADDVIAKPISRISLIEAVNRLIRDRSRGLKRVSLETSVRIHTEGGTSLGRALNVSRGGIFVEADPVAEATSEVRLEFQLPEAPETLTSTARVIWRRDPAKSARTGMGLQFLALDRRSSRWIEDFVYENDELPRVSKDERISAAS